MSSTVTSVKTENVIVTSAQGGQGPQGLQGLPGTTTETGFTTSTNISGHVVVYINTNGELALASSDSSSSNFVIGITTSASTTGQQTLVSTAGAVEHLGWAFTPGYPVFLGLNGVATQTIPPTALYSKVIGYATSSTGLMINIQPSIQL